MSGISRCLVKVNDRVWEPVKTAGRIPNDLAIAGGEQVRFEIPLDERGAYKIEISATDRAGLTYPYPTFTIPKSCLTTLAIHGYDFSQGTTMLLFSGGV